MKTVGIRELKNSLSNYVREVNDGATIIVTDRGLPVAKLVPLTESSVEEHPFAEMARRGEARIGQPLDPKVKAEIRARRMGRSLLRGTTITELLDALREDTV
jgi:prevent-host-death family protein